MNELEKYYNKFNEDKRLLSRHGQVEFFVATHYIDEVIAGRQNLKILDVGAGTGRYSFFYAEKGHDVTAVEPVKKNLSFILKAKNVTAKQGNALELKFKDNTFDVVLLFGPLYHLLSHEEKHKALEEAKRVTKPGGKILTMYLSNEYAIVMYALKEGHLMECIKSGKIDKDFQTVTDKKDLYSYVRLEEINALTDECGLVQEKIIGVDGSTDYIRPVINELTAEEFGIYKKYILSIAERPELLGASSHIMQILKK